LFKKFIFWCVDCGIVGGEDEEEIDCPCCGKPALRQHQFDSMCCTKGKK
jgi:rubrerythrin